LRVRDRTIDGHPIGFRHFWSPLAMRLLRCGFTDAAFADAAFADAAFADDWERNEAYDRFNK
jgi:hypothetical protein